MAAVSTAGAAARASGMQAAAQAARAKRVTDDIAPPRKGKLVGTSQRVAVPELNSVNAVTLSAFVQTPTAPGPVMWSSRTSM